MRRCSRRYACVCRSDGGTRRPRQIDSGGTSHRHVARSARRGTAPRPDHRPRLRVGRYRRTRDRIRRRPRPRTLRREHARRRRTRPRHHVRRRRHRGLDATVRRACRRAARPRRAAPAGRDQQGRPRRPHVGHRPGATAASRRDDRARHRDRLGAKRTHDADGSATGAGHRRRRAAVGGPVVHGARGRHRRHGHVGRGHDPRRGRPGAQRPPRHRARRAVPGPRPVRGRRGGPRGGQPARRRPPQRHAR